MPAYQNNPFSTARFLQKGVAEYLFGSYNYHQANTRMLVSNVALTTNVATLTVQIVEGEIPIVGALVSVQQTASTAGLFNVNRAPITGVTINATTGAGTITFALTHANVGSTANTGSAIAEVPEVGEAIVAQASVPCVVAAPEGDSQFTVPVSVTFSTLPTAVTVSLQMAIRDNDAEYTTLGNVAVVAGSNYNQGPIGAFTLQRGYFYRFINSGLTLGSGAGQVAKIGG